MQTKNDVLRLALALIKAGDADLVAQQMQSAARHLGAGDQARVQEIGGIVQALCHDYAFAESAAFRRDMASRTQGYVDVKTRLESAPARKCERLDALYAAIRASIAQPALLHDLARESDQHRVQALHRLLDDLPIPAE